MNKVLSLDKQTNASRSTVAGIKVAFVPVWDGNPYHPQLMAALKGLGVEMSDVHNVKGLFFGRDKVDVIHLHTLPYLDCSPVNLARYVSFYRRLREMQKLGTRIVWTVHDYRNHDSVFWPIEGWMSRRMSQWADAIIVHGDTARQTIEATWGSKRVSVIPHGHYIDSYKNEISPSAARQALGLDESNVAFLFLGLIRPYKGVEQLVRSFKRCGARSARLVIAGRPVDERMFRKVSSAIEGDARIQFHPGFVAPDQVQNYMNACDVAVFPYLRILTSGATVLAMSFGKCCIAPRTGCIRDVLDDKGALFFDPNRPGDLETALTRAISIRQNLARMGQHNLCVASHWSWQRIAIATSDVYRAALARKNH